MAAAAPLLTHLGEEDLPLQTQVEQQEEEEEQEVVAAAGVLVAVLVVAAAVAKKQKTAFLEGQPVKLGRQEEEGEEEILDKA